jgi:hypothetical protein
MSHFIAKALLTPLCSSVSSVVKGFWIFSAVKNLLGVRP